jgi:hypothetical protein
VLEKYYTLVEKNEGRLSKGGHEYNGANQAFYDWQVRSGGWDLIAQQEEVKKLMEIFQQTTDIFLRSIGQDEEFIKNRGRAIQIWATVHESTSRISIYNTDHFLGCISHLPHSHPDQIVSGVYYVKMPTEAGSITFDDPRGPLPPFDNRITIRPQQGDLILFPRFVLKKCVSNFGIVG